MGCHQLLMGVLVWSSISSLHFIRLLGVSLLNDCQSRLRTRLLSCEMTIRPPNRAGRKDSSNSQPLFLLLILSDQDFWNPLPCLCLCAPTTRLRPCLNEKFDISVPLPQESSPSLRIAHAGGLLHYHRAVSSWAWKCFTMVGQWVSQINLFRKLRLRHIGINVIHKRNIGAKLSTTLAQNVHKAEHSVWSWLQEKSLASKQLFVRFS
jgi:hypothetical protein